MARTELTVTDMSTSANSLNGVTMVGTAGIADGHKFLCTGKEYVLITKSSTTGDVTFQTPATVHREPIAERAVTLTTAALPMVIENFPCSVFAQTDGMVYVDYEVGEESEFTIQVFKKADAR